MTIALWILIFITGACIGSFLNVCIYRMPLEKSIIRPGSHCAACGSPIPWKYNIPIISWFWLKGKAACCGTKIDRRYPLVETLTALGVTTLWALYPPPLAAIYTIYFAGLVVITLIDIDHFIIPDEISLGGCLVGLLLSYAYPPMQGFHTPLAALAQSAIGLFFGGILLLIIAVVGSLILRKEAMGMGDVKLMAAMGAFLGWQAPIFILVFASFVGSAFGITVLLRKRKMWGVRMPFGPFLALSGFVWLLGGKQWMAEYLRMFF